MRLFLSTLVSRIWPYLLLAVLAVAFFGDGFFGHQAICARDTFFGLPGWIQNAGHTLSTDERLLFWNPFSGYGKPYIADPENGFFYPPNWIFYVLPAGLALTTFWTAHLAVSGMSVYTLARHWKMSTGPALLAAVSFMFSTWMVGMMEFRAPFAVCAWGPLSLLVTNRFLEHFVAGAESWWNRLGRGLGEIALLSLLFALQYLAGNPERLAYLILLLAGYVAARALWLRSWTLFAGGGALLAAAGVIALGLSLPQFLLSWEFIQNSERASGAPFSPGLDIASFHPRQLLTLLLPFLYGRPGYADNYWAPAISEFWAGTCYIGVAPVIGLALAPLCLRARVARHDERRFVFCFFALVAVFALVMSAGKYMPMYMLVRNLVPGFSHFRWPSKFLLLLLYSLCFLAALGWQEVLDTTPAHTVVGRQRWWLAFAVFAAFAGISALAGLAANGRPDLFSWLTGGRFINTPEHLAEAFGDYGRYLIFLSVTLAGWGLHLAGLLGRRLLMGLLIVATFIDLFTASRSVQWFTDRDIYSLPPDAAPAEVLARADGYVFSLYSSSISDPAVFYGCRSRKIYAWATSANVNNVLQTRGVYGTYQYGLKLEEYPLLQKSLLGLPPAQSSRLADLMSIRYVITGPSPKAVLRREIAPDSLRYTERPSALPPAYLVPSWRVVTEREAAFPVLISDSFNPRTEAVISAPDKTSALPSPPETSAQNAGMAKIIELKWNSVAVRAQSAARCLLILNQSWYPGWTARVDGRPAPIYVANTYFRAVELPPGQHEIVFTYLPGEFFPACLIAALTALALGVAVWRCGGGKSARPRPSPAKRPCRRRENLQPCI